MAAKEQGLSALSERLGKKVQQHHGIAAEHHAEPWKPAGSRSAHSSGTIHSLYYAPLTSAHPPTDSSRQRGHTGSYAGSSVSSEASSNNKEIELRSSRIFKPKRPPCTKLLVDQTRPSSRWHIRCSQGSGSSETRQILKPVNGAKSDTSLQGASARHPGSSSCSYSTVVTSTFSISDSMLVSRHSCNQASGISNASTALPASPGVSMAGSGGSSDMHHSCSPTRGSQQQLLFGMQGGCAQQHTSPAALRYLFQEPSSNTSSSSSSSSNSSTRHCSQEQNSSFQGILQRNGTLGHLQQRRQQQQQLLTAQGQGMLPCIVPEQLQEVAKLSKPLPHAVTYCYGPGAAVMVSQSCASEATRDYRSCAQQHPQGTSSQPQSISPPQSMQPSSQKSSSFKALAAQGMQQDSTRQQPSVQLQQVDQHPTSNAHSRVSQAGTGCTDRCSAANSAAQHVRLYLDQRADPFEPRTIQQAQWQQERQTRVQHQSTPIGSACAPSTAAAAAHSVSYQQLLNSCASVVHNSNASYMQMKRYQWQRSNAPLGTPGTSTRPLSRMRAQDCSSPKVFCSVPATPSRMKLVDALRVSSPAASCLPESPACTPGLQDVPQFSSQGMNTQLLYSQHPRSSTSSSARSSLQAEAPPASPAWSVYLTPAPAAKAGSVQNAAQLLRDRSAPALAHTGGQRVSKAVQTSPPDYRCSSHHVPEPSPWWRGLQQNVCRPSPDVKVQPRVLFEATSPASAKSPAACSEGVSPAHFPFRCRSTSTDAAAGNDQQDEGSSSVVSISPGLSNPESDSDIEQETQARHAAHKAAAGLACSPLLDHGEQWSVHNNALAWARESTDAATVGMRSIEELVHQPAAANGGSISRRPLLPVVIQQQQASSQFSFSGGAAAIGRENISPADALAGLTQLAHKLVVSIDDTAAPAVAPVVSKADVGLVVLASPLAGCGRWQQGSNISMHDV